VTEQNIPDPEEPVIRFFEIRSGTREYGWCGGFRVGMWPGRNESEALAAYANDPTVPARYCGRTDALAATEPKP